MDRPGEPANGMRRSPSLTAEMAMLQSPRRLLGLCLVPVLLAALDGCLTLKGQPQAYWAGDHLQVLEGTPGFYILLTHGMILLLPPTLALATCLGFTLGHAIGAFSW